MKNARLSSGVLGGFVAALIMGTIVTVLMPIPNTGGAPFFVAAAMIMGLSGALAWAGGWMLHIITGIVAGLVFVTVTNRVRRLAVRDVRHAVGFGASFGIIMWIVFFLPMMIALMPQLMSMTTLVIGSFIVHMMFGIILSMIVTIIYVKGH